MSSKRGASRARGDDATLGLFAADSAPPPPPPARSAPRTTPPAPKKEEVPAGSTPAAAVSVSALTQIARDVLEGAFLPLWIRGEVTDFKAHRNGHWYFCLRDRGAQLRCVVWSRDRQNIPAPPDEGMQVTAFGQLTLYPTRGDLQVAITAIEATGDGLRRKALELTRQALTRDGLLDPSRKRALPTYPRCVAVITSPDGAALHDIVSVARRRNPATQMVVVPAVVQGDNAPISLRKALYRVVRWGRADVIIIGRGGGAKEDLWAFNDERLARAIAKCPVPVISAVGHEVDVTICDLVADLRAATPSVAAEMAVPSRDRAIARVQSLGRAIARRAEGRISAARVRLERTSRAMVRAGTAAMERRRARLHRAAGQLDALSPLATLARGYAVVRQPDGTAVTSTSAVSAGDQLDIVLRDGVVRAIAESVEPRPPADDPTILPS
jgi:exodeoxyribonuclease VII large subunit